MTLWTTFTPQKISWELNSVLTEGRSPDSNWQNHLDLIVKSLKKLHDIGIFGIRLVIYPDELTEDGKRFDWEPLETMLDLCKKHTLQVDLCIGPFQYPNYPGIFLPKGLLRYVFANGRALDTTNAIRSFGEFFIEQQLERYGDDNRIRGFHFANEWPDKQRVMGREKVRTWVSQAFMLQIAASLKRNTQKQIAINTNIDAANKKKLAGEFGELLSILEDQGRLGFDIYPSQETWKKAFSQKLMRFLEPYHRSYQWSQKHFSLTALYFCEVEAQPWGNGQSWFQIISHASNKEEQVLGYTTDSLAATFANYIKRCKPYEVSLWGADFWLVANEMGLTWPLQNIKEMHAISSTNS